MYKIPIKRNRKKFDSRSKIWYIFFSESHNFLFMTYSNNCLTWQETFTFSSDCFSWISFNITDFDDSSSNKIFSSKSLLLIMIKIYDKHTIFVFSMIWFFFVLICGFSSIYLLFIFDEKFFSIFKIHFRKCFRNYHFYRLK